MQSTLLNSKTVPIKEGIGRAGAGCRRAVGGEGHNPERRERGHIAAVVDHVEVRKLCGQRSH